MSLNFLCLKVDHRTFDIFEGKQWSSWSRLKSGKQGVYVTGGEKLPFKTVKAIASQINPKESIQTIEV